MSSTATHADDGRAVARDPFGLERNDVIPQVMDILALSERYELAAGEQNIFT